MNLKIESGDTVGFLILLIWTAGIVISDGFWSCFFSIIFPPWAFYLTLESMMQMIGMV